jgi:cobalt-zinc-cadmium efflux system protein
MASGAEHSHDDHHHHSGGHHHHHAAKNIKVAFFLNLGFTILEVVGGFLTNSTAILADAAHDLGDCFALGQAWYFERLSGEESNAKYSYGYKRFSMFGALISTVLLLVSSLFILSTAIPRIFHPGHPDARGMVALALVGVAVNGFAMLRLSKEKGMNTRVVALHLLEDVLGWVAVLVVSVVMLFVDLPVLDPILAVLITLYILSNVIKNLKTMLPIFLQAVPENVSLETIIDEIGNMEHVSAVHQARIWSLDGEHNVFTAHLEVDRQFDPYDYGCMKETIRSIIERHGIYHSTVEIEFPGEVCRHELPPR